MQKKNGTIIYAASDLSSFMQCRRRGALDMAAIRDNRAIPRRKDPQLELLQPRGLIYETICKTAVQMRSANGLCHYEEKSIIP